MRRVAITGLGVLSPLGNNAAELFQQARAGRSAVRRLDTPWARRLNAPLGASVQYQPEAHFEAARLRLLDRVSQFAILAARQAIADAQLQPVKLDRRRAGIFIGTAMGGCGSWDETYQTLYREGADRLKPFSMLLAMESAPANWLSVELGISGPTLTYSTVCSSSSVAIGEAWRQLRAGELDIAFAGGTEAPLSLGAMKAWESMQTLATADQTAVEASCRPFDRRRSGMVLGEGAAMVILEDWTHAQQRGARIHAELVGYGLATDCIQISRPSVAGQTAAMQAALQSGGSAPESIDAILAHATGTRANDGVETGAIKRLLGDAAGKVPVSATKAIHGHLLGASGALNLVLSVLSIRHGVLFPTMHLQLPDEDCDLDYVPQRAREGVAVRTVLSNSFAFGGTNASLLTRAVS